MRKLAAALALIFSILTPAYAFALDNNGPGRGIPEKIESRIADIRMKFEEERAKFASASALRKTALQAKLKTFKDQKKANVALRVSDNLNKVNQNRTTEMLSNLDKMDALLTKVDTKVAAITDKDTTEVASNSASTKQLIATAREAVQAQSIKDYTITATADATLKTDVKSMRDELFADLKEVHQQIMTARMSLAVTVKALGGLI